MAVVTSAQDVTEDMLESAESIFDGWYSDSGRIDWTDFFERLESYGDWDFGSDWMSPAITRIKKHIAAYRKM